MDSPEGFPDYTPSSNDTGAALYAFVVVYSVLSFLLIAPLVIWARNHERRRLEELHRSTFYNPDIELSQYPGDPLQQYPAQLEEDIRRQNQDIFRNAAPMQVNMTRPRQQMNSRQTSFSKLFQELDRLAATAYPDDDPDFMSAISGSQRELQIGAPNTRSDASAGNSNVQSAATTSRLYQRPSQQPKTQIWDVHGRRWRQRRPIGRVDTMHRAIVNERKKFEETHNRTETHSLTSQNRRRPSFSTGSRQNSKSSSKNLSDVASSVLDEDDMEDAPQRQSRRRGHSRGNSLSSFSEPSILPSIVDDISPNDAADAGDPGRVNSFEQEYEEVTVCCGTNALWRRKTIGAAIDGLVFLSEPDLEMRRIISISFPLTFGAISESLSNLITAAVIGRNIGTDSMVAYVLVLLLIGFSDDLVGAISDAESTLCSHALSSGNWFLAGQYAQIGIILTVVVSIPILLLWREFMGDVVGWLTGSEHTASVAADFTNVIVLHHFLQLLSRTFTTLFHLNGSEHFEARFGIVEGLVSLITVCCVVSLVPEASLREIAFLQLLVGLCAFLVKIGYAVFNGWLRLFWKGMRSCAFTNIGAVGTLSVTSLPLLIGAFLEYGEWEILIFFVAKLGHAEVATWAILGLVWRILETATEGIGEAAAIRVAYHLGMGNADMAKLSSYKALFVSTVQSFLITSALFMAGKNIASLLTADPTLQNLLNNVITYIGFGNAVMSFALVTWSLVGAQGRYRLATLLILVSRWLVTLPMAAICVYAYNLDLKSIMGSVIVGFATANSTLSYVFFRSDWERLARIIQELNAMVDIDFSDSEDDSSLGGASSQDSPLPEQENSDKSSDP